MWNAGVEVVVAVQGLGQGVRALFQALSFLGSELFFLLLVPLVYWTIDARAGMRIGLILLISTGVNTLLKLVFADPRPYWYSDRVLAYAAESSFGLPSGHSQISASVWGMLAFTARRWWFWVFAIALVVLIGISRIYLGVHFPSDVLAGWAIGAALLVCFVALAERAEAWLSRRALGSQVLVAFVTSLLLIAPAWLVVAAQRGSADCRRHGRSSRQGVTSHLIRGRWTPPPAWQGRGLVSSPAWPSCPGKGYSMCVARWAGGRRVSRWAPWFCC